MLPVAVAARLLALAIAFTGIALLAAGLVPDVGDRAADRGCSPASARVSPPTPGTPLLDQETEDYRRARTTEHLHAVVRVFVALGALVGARWWPRRSARTGWRAASSSSRTAAPPSP